MNHFVKNMLLYSINKNGLNYNKMLEYCNMYSCDRRYKPFILTSTCAYAYCNHSGIIRYMNCEYYYRFIDKDNVVIERR